MLLTRRIAGGTEDLGCSSLGWPFRCGFLGGCDWCWKLGFFQSVARALLLGQVISSCCATQEEALAVASRGLGLWRTYVMVVEGMRFRSRIVNWDCER